MQEAITSVVSENGIVVIRKSDNAVDLLQKTGFEVLDVRNRVLLATRPQKTTRLQGRRALILVSPFFAIFSRPTLAD